MKKLLFTLCALSTCLFAKAQVTGTIYVEDATVQAGQEAELKVMATGNTTLAGIIFTVDAPAGVVFAEETTGDPKVTNTKSVLTTTSFKNEDKTQIGVAFANANNIFALTETPQQIGTLYITAPSTPGQYNIKVSGIKMSTDLEQTDLEGAYTSVLTVQRAAAISAQDVNYCFEVAPFATEAGKTYTSTADNSIAVPIILKNADYISAASFSLTLPNGFGIASYKSGMKTSTKQPVVNTNRSYNVNSEEPSDPALSFTQSKSSQVVTYTLGSTGDGDYVNSNGTGVIATVYLTSDASLKDSIYTFKIDNVSITSTPDGESSTIHEGGEYYFSVFVGQSADNAILYGNYNDAAKAAAVAALKGGSADITTTNLSDFAPNDVLVYGKANTTYNRTVTGLGTVCLPIDLTSGANVQYYTLKEETTEGLVFEKAESVPANTPALVGGKIAASAEGYKYAAAATNKAVGDWTMKGTYALMTDVTGMYYVTNSQIYKAVEPISINPFRAYFESQSSSDAKSFGIFIEDETGIREVTDQLSKEDIYNLQGIKLGKVQKGINIINGKKVLVK